jgi:hypothetical protein
MNRVSTSLVSLLCLGSVACSSETFQHEVSIVGAPPAVPCDPPSALQVPKRCPVYAPGGGDVDTPEAPFPDEFSIICAVDGTGATYGIVGGDAPTSHLAVLPGDRELGLYFGFKPGSNLNQKYSSLAGDDANAAMYAAPSSIYTSDCCAESHPEGRLAIRAVASGPEGLLVSAGTFGGSRTQLAGWLALRSDLNVSWVFRFYVNGDPGLP